MIRLKPQQEAAMAGYLVSVEFQGKRRESVELPVEAAEPILAAEKAEWIAAKTYGGALEQWFAWKVEPNQEIRN
jgi:hypothetical protein